MTRWWSLARGEWIFLGILAGAVLGILVATVLGLEDIAAWAIWSAAALGFGGLVQLATRGRGTADLPTVGSLAYFSAGIPVLAVWWFLVSGMLQVPSEVGPEYVTFFVAGIVAARIVVRLVSDYAALDGGRPNPRLRVPRSLF